MSRVINSEQVHRTYERLVVQVVSHSSSMMTQYYLSSKYSTKIRFAACLTSSTKKFSQVTSADSLRGELYGPTLKGFL